MGDAAIAWQEARRLAEQLEEITGELAKSIAEERVEKFAPLLERRQGICDRFDCLRSKWGVVSWTNPGQGDLAPEIKMAARELREIFGNLASADEEMRQVLLEKMAAVKGDLKKIRQLRQAQRVYVEQGGSPYGAFIDNKL